MPFAYQPAELQALRQGELLQLASRHVLDYDVDDPPEVRTIIHNAVVILTADCDLLQDYNARKVARDAGKRLPENDPRLIPQLLCCETFAADAMKVRSKGASFDRVRDNQVERFHCLPEDPAYQGLGELLLDFRRAVGLEVAHIYRDIGLGATQRTCVVPPIYLQGLMHRFYSYLSRVGDPD